jgi:hypothetical protein
MAFCREQGRSGVLMVMIFDGVERLPVGVEATGGRNETTRLPPSWSPPFAEGLRHPRPLGDGQKLPGKPGGEQPQEGREVCCLADGDAGCSLEGCEADDGDAGCDVPVPCCRGVPRSQMGLQH